MYGTGMPDIKYVPRSRTDQTRLKYLWHGDAKARRCLYIYIYIRNQHGTEMPDFWPIQLETGALPNVPFPPITLVFIVSPRVESC